jgi:hypothetical protein
MPNKATIKIKTAINIFFTFELMQTNLHKNQVFFKKIN